MIPAASLSVPLYSPQSDFPYPFWPIIANLDEITAACLITQQGLRTKVGALSVHERESARLPSNLNFASLAWHLIALA